MFVLIVLLLFHFCVFLSRLSELVWKLAGEISYQLALKRFPSLGPPANGNESNAKKSRFRPNRNFKGTIYHWSVILRSFSVVSNSAKRDANWFFKVLLLSSHRLISQQDEQKSKFWAYAESGYFSFKCNMGSLRKHPFLLALRRWGRFARRNVCDSVTEIPYCWRNPMFT